MAKGVEDRYDGHLLRSLFLLFLHWLCFKGSKTFEAPIEISAMKILAAIGKHLVI
jgi:hypothetical protein